METEVLHQANRIIHLLGLNPYGADGLDRMVVVVLILLFVFLIYMVCRYVVVGGLKRLLRALKVDWGKHLFDAHVVQKFLNVLPVVVLYLLLPLALMDHPDTLTLLRKVCVIYLMITVLLFLNRLIKVLFEQFKRRNELEDRPIKGLLQIVQVSLVFIGVVVSISLLVNQSPAKLLAGLGASAAILLLIFKGSITGFVSGIQLTVNDMLRAGDWITVPEYGANGTVVEVNLTTVKVENFDNTITTLPPDVLVSGSFQNWRGMELSAGRRIMRSVFIDMNSTHFCTPQELEELCQIPLLAPYLHTLPSATKTPYEGPTNIGLFRSYLRLYLQNLDQVNHELTCMVRHLQPTPNGIPLEIYCFSHIKEWVAYEGVQADLFDHIMAIAPLFHLVMFQYPTGTSVDHLAPK